MLRGRGAERERALRVLVRVSPPRDAAGPGSGSVSQEGRGRDCLDNSAKYMMLGFFFVRVRVCS